LSSGILCFLGLTSFILSGTIWCMATKTQTKIERSIVLEAATVNELQRIASEEGTNISIVIRQLLRLGISQRQRRKVREVESVTA